MCCKPPETHLEYCKLLLFTVLKRFGMVSIHVSVSFGAFSMIFMIFQGSGSLAGQDEIYNGFGRPG